MLQNIIKRQNKIDDLYYTEEELGAIYKNGITEFKLWSPTSKKITLNIFDKNNKNQLIKTVYPKKSQVVVEGCKVVKKAIKPSEKNPKGGFISKEMPMDISNVALVEG